MGILKKGELQTQETILAVFIFTIIIIIGMVVFFRFQENSLNANAAEFRLEQFGNKIVALAETPELVYTEAGIKKNAVDTLKLIAFQNLVQRKKKYYTDKLGYMNITITQVYPTKNKNKCSVNRISDCSVWEIYNNVPKDGINSRIRRETPVSLYFPETGKYSIGVLSAEVYNA